jgi:hypothetical protein
MRKRDHATPVEHDWRALALKNLDHAVERVGARAVSSGGATASVEHVHDPAEHTRCHVVLRVHALRDLLLHVVRKERGRALLLTRQVLRLGHRLHERSDVGEEGHVALVVQPSHSRQPRVYSQRGAWLRRACGGEGWGGTRSQHEHDMRLECDAWLVVEVGHGGRWWTAGGGEQRRVQVGCATWHADGQ